MKRWIYGLLGIGVLALAGFMIQRALSDSLVYFILPSEYAASPQEYQERRIRLGGIVAQGTIQYNEEQLHLAFNVTDSLETYPVQHSGTPPELFQENTGVVVEGRFEDGVFVSDNLLVKHSEVYEAPEPGQHVDLEELKDTLQ
ncbi:MAG: cytochrome c maturation protein CcmE [Deinococcus-Thermus bacterium]|jgi:cytochrome c-type biogenesis protein CcmE|nr:cytochrome c maturation protein CcmE [Deinococcota bacterium]